MRWLPLATNAILTPGGSILTRDVRQKTMKTAKAYILGLFGLLLAMLMPICMVAVANLMIFGKGVWDQPPDTRSAGFFVNIALIGLSASYAASAYLFRFLIPWFARLRILKVGDKQSTVLWLNWVDYSLRRTHRDYEALVQYRNDLAEQCGGGYGSPGADSPSPHR